MVKPVKMRSRTCPQIGLINEDDYAHEMLTIVEPYLAKVRVSGFVSDKLKLYYELYPLKYNKGTIVISQGYSESCEKWHEMIYYFMQAGYQIAVYDHRGHGHSFRQVKDKELIHVDDFADYVFDMHEFLHRIVLKRLESDRRNLYLFAHSMGGCIAAGYLERFPHDFGLAIINSPMFGIDLRRYGASEKYAYALCRFNVEIGNGKKKASRQSGFSPDVHYEDGPGYSAPRYQYYHLIRTAEPAYQTAVSTFKWSLEAFKAGHEYIKPRNVKKIKTPVLLIIAEKDSLVTRKPQLVFAEHLQNLKFVVVPESKHEIYRIDNKNLESYIGLVLDWIDRNRAETYREDV